MKKRHPEAGRFVLALAVLLRGDTARAAPPSVPPPRAPDPVAAEPLLQRMHRHFNALPAIHRALIAGDLDGARRAARPLILISAGALIGREDRVAEIRRTARRLASARSERAARSLAAALATQCARCHLDTAEVSRFVWSPEPSDDGSATARMARHRWASEMVWMGLVAPADQPWGDGMEALSEPPLLPEAMSDDRELYSRIDLLGRRLQIQAARARTLRGSRERASAFAEMMGLCAGCHEIARR